ncbi:unnamed protein product [marine sediment metagenome]|uniref:Uncharacterized protein n=1 Tax=marine sediment metagenome TaxID=412755 RepID=X0WY18_9ZZZZ
MNHICNAVDEKCKETKCECKEPHKWKAECLGACLSFARNKCLDCKITEECKYAQGRESHFGSQDPEWQNPPHLNSMCKNNNVRFRKCVKV